MMNECSPGELLASVAFMHYDDKGHSNMLSLKGKVFIMKVIKRGNVAR